MASTIHQLNGLLRWRTSPRLLMAGTLAMIVGFSGICAQVMLSMRSADYELARETIENLSTSIDADIARNIEIYDLSLRAAVASSPLVEVQKANPSLRRLILFDHAATAQFFGAMQILNASADVDTDSSTDTPIRKNYSDEHFFKIHKQDPLAGLYISSPMLHNGTYCIVLSRRITAADGSFAGVVTGSIQFNYFHGLIGRLQLNPDDTVTILRQDGIVIMRRPFDLDIIGKDISHGVVAQRALAYLSGSLTSQSVIDNIDRLFVWRDGSHPLIVIVGRSLNDIYSRWNKTVLWIGAALTFLGLTAVTGVLLLSSEMAKRTKAELELTRLATTDALTGLCNRRRFDVVAELEWERGKRQHAPLALLMIDADHFKSFNDQFGHQAGDKVLSTIGKCIADAARRAGDCGARYGGEEFAVLLPGMKLAEALLLGDRIRRQIELCAEIPATISVGGASVIPAANMNVTDLIASADAALYRAKEKGRNQTYPPVLPHILRVA
jgi:diguanylate cyclase (GGDEF)-like protein